MLENNIHKVEMNMMEAEHMHKKYRSIRGGLLEDSVLFESTLKKLERNIMKQDSEIKHLQVILAVYNAELTIHSNLVLSCEKEANHKHPACCTPLSLCELSVANNKKNIAMLSKDMSVITLSKPK